jgi:hypothetical protein
MALFVLTGYISMFFSTSCLTLSQQFQDKDYVDKRKQIFQIFWISIAFGLNAPTPRRRGEKCRAAAQPVTPA